MSREEPSGEVEVAEVGEHEEIGVGEDCTESHHILQHCRELNDLLKFYYYWIAGDGPLKGLLPSAKNLMFFLPLYV